MEPNSWRPRSPGERVSWLPAAPTYPAPPSTPRTIYDDRGVAYVAAPGRRSSDPTDGNRVFTAAIRTGPSPRVGDVHPTSAFPPVYEFHGPTFTLESVGVDPTAFGRLAGQPERINVMKTKPVVVLTVVYTVLIVLLGTAGVTEVLPPAVLTVATVVATALGALLGISTYNRVTPLAKPEDAAGRPLAPVTAPRTMYGDTGGR